MTCPDYDLCSECQPKGIHSHHQFKTISKPTRSGRCPFSGRHRGPHGGLRHGAGWRHYMRNNHHHQPSSTGTEQASTSAESSAQRPNPLHETLNNFLPYLANSMPIVNDPEQLKSVGEYLKQFLDPFGIDVSYYVDNISKASEASKNAKESEKPKTSENATTAQQSENLMETLEKPISTEVLTPTVVEKSTVTARSSSSMDSADQVTTSSMITSTTTTTATSAVAASAPVKESSPYEAAANALKSVIEKNDADVSAKESLITEDSGFNLVDIEKELKFINCVEQLRAMGYTDDAGWLTRLVIAKDGNINAVLDSLHPIRN
jgi:sequestosome 1